MPIRVLFVDDEQNVLEGLRRMMRVVRKEWDMEFAEGASEALKRMAASRYDVVVSDIRMPSMDGASLLSETATRHPETIRMVLSGQCDQEASCRLVGPSHQFHNKPCNSDQLVGAVRRALALRDSITAVDVQQLVTALRALPSPADLRERLIGGLHPSEADIEKVADVVAEDMGLTAKLLQLANSGYFSVAANIVNPLQAVRQLGIEQLHALVTNYDMLWSYQPDGDLAPRIEAIWRRGPARAYLARMVAKDAGLGAPDTDVAQVSGLLQEAGDLVLAANGQTANGDGPAIGAYLTGLWGLPEKIEDTILAQGTETGQMDGPLDAAAAVRVASQLLDEIDPQGAPDGQPCEIDEGQLQRHELLGRLEGWRAKARETAAKGRGP